MPTKINTREELLMALTEAAELEHGLACQYLFTAFTIRPSSDPGLSQAQRTKLRQWRGDILRIAKEEMEHLATVTNLLSAIGGAPHFRRPNFPQPPKYYPPDIPFWLEKFDEESLSRYIEFERNDTAPGPAAAVAPGEVSYRHVGELYEAIIEAFKTLPEVELFINKAAQDTALVGQNVEPAGATSRGEAVAALESLMKEGEGHEPGVEWSHYCAFFKILHELRAEKAASGDFKPSRSVLINPKTRNHRGQSDGNLITNIDTRSAVELFNCLYCSMVLIFEQYFSFAGEDAAQRQTLQEQLMRLMQEVIAPLGVILTTLPAIEGDDAGEKAGASFEFYGTYRLSATPRVAWAVIIEKLTREIQQTSDLATTYAARPGGDPGFEMVADVVTEIRNRLKSSAPI